VTGTQQQRYHVPVSGGSIEVIVDQLVDEDPDLGTEVSSPINLVCLHGWTLDSRSFAPQLSLVSSRLRLVRYDRRGFGSNRLSPCFQTELDDLGAILMSLHGPVVLWGVSQGARLALRYWVTAQAYEGGNMPHPDGVISQGGHVDGLAIDDPDSDAIPFDRYRQLLAQGDRDSFMQEWGQHPLVVGGATQNQRAALAALADGYTGADLLTEGALPAPMDVRAALPHLQAPLLVVTGTEETASRQRHSAYLAEQVPLAQAVTIGGGGHLCNVTHADDVNADVRGWLAINNQRFE